MPELMTQPVVEALSGRVRIQNGKQHLHRRGWFLAGEVLLDGQHVVSYTNPEGKMRCVDFLMRSHCQKP